MKIKLTGVSPTLKAEVERYSFEVGILKNSKVKKAKVKTIKNYAGGPARIIGKETSIKMQQLGAWLNKRYKWLSRPFKEKKNKDIILFADTYINEISKQKKSVNKKKLENLMQAVVRNPILRGDYGSNTAQRQKAKGFDRLLIDTGKFFDSIKARAISNGN